MQHINKKLANYFINNSFNNDLYLYKDKNNIYFIEESKRWREIIIEKRETDSTYTLIAKMQINLNQPNKYFFMPKIFIQNNIRYVFNLILLNRIYKYN